MLKEFLPKKQQDRTYLKDNLDSPQFAQALSKIDSAFYSPQCIDIFKSFGIFDQQIFDKAKDRELNSYRCFYQNDG